MPICPRCGKKLSTEQSLQYHLSKKTRCDSKQKFKNSDICYSENPIFKLLCSNVDFESTVLIIDQSFKILAISKYDDNEIKNQVNLLANIKFPATFVDNFHKEQVYQEFYTIFSNDVRAKIKVYKTGGCIYIKKTLWE